MKTFTIRQWPTGATRTFISFSAACLKRIEKKYKFYLSFENSLCPDYVTDKLFRILKLNVIPIGFGVLNYSTVVPPKSCHKRARFSRPQRTGWENQWNFRELWRVHQLFWMEEIVRDFKAPSNCWICKRSVVCNVEFSPGAKIDRLWKYSRVVFRRKMFHLSL